MKLITFNSKQKIEIEFVGDNLDLYKIVHQNKNKIISLQEINF